MRPLFAFLILLLSFTVTAQSYKIVDTGQETAYNNNIAINLPLEGLPFYGQDANYSGAQPSYTDNGDGTVTDNVTGLMWAQTCDLNGDGEINVSDKLSYEDAIAAADTFSLAGYNDWRLPDIKEQYSLILFSGVDPSGYEGTSTSGLVPFINTDFFGFNYGDTGADERIIDAQMATSTLYVSTTMMGDETMFGVNFADGRIKGYGTGPLPGGTEDKLFYVYFVRGNENYGENDFEDNGDATITDNATGLMWSRDDNGEGILWEDALEYAESSTLSGYSDWRLPNAKELQSIVDYTRSPATTSSAAIDPLFNCTQIQDEGGEADYAFYWTSTTHRNWSSDAYGTNAAYVSFGEALGFMEMPPGSGTYNLLDVHGAGAQRSDPKTGNPEDYPYGHGPQGDVIRIYNYVRLVRDITTDIGESSSENTDIRVFPNPVADELTIFSHEDNLTFHILNQLGEVVFSGEIFSGNNPVNVSGFSPGFYYIRVFPNEGNYVSKFIKF